MNIKDVRTFISKNSPTILTCLSVGGTVMTAIMASQATLKAHEILEPYDYELKKEDILKKTWKCYIPTVLSGTATVGCILGSHYCSSKQREVLTSAYLLSQTTLQEYQKKVVERIGKNKERALREEVVQEIADTKAPVMLYSEGVSDVIDTRHGNTLFYDVPGERYFKSDINYLKTQVNDLNREVLTEMEFDWNELNYRWGLPFKKYGGELIFDVDRPLEVSYVPEMMENGQVRICVDYRLYPKGI